MTTILVWVAVLYTGDPRGGYTVIDGIATKADCQRIVERAVALNHTWGPSHGTCTQYRKVVTK